MTELLYLTDSYQKKLTAKIISCQQKGKIWEIILDKTLFYPQGGGQPADKGTIMGANGKAIVKYSRMMGEDVVHECSIEGSFADNEKITCEIDWNRRYNNMKRHTAGHILHEAIMKVVPNLQPVKADHGDKPYIEYLGSISIIKTTLIENESNEIVQNDRKIITAFVTLKELKERVSFVPEHLPKHKPLRIVEIAGFNPIPDGGTQVASTHEVEHISIISIENTNDSVRVFYNVDSKKQDLNESLQHGLSSQTLVNELISFGQTATQQISESTLSLDELTNIWLGKESEFTKLSQSIRFVPKEDKQPVGIVLNQVKQSIETVLSHKSSTHASTEDWLDVTAPGINPEIGHLHIVSQAIEEITQIFNKLGFTRTRHPEVDWDYYAFEALNMPKNHPARDEWETFFIRHTPSSQTNAKFQKMVLTPHTSNGQIREMEKGLLPIRMINIAKCYRRQIDVSHTPMFHQFEGLYVDKNVSIGHLKGVLDYFAKAFFGKDRVTRIRPFHFQFTEPSFEIDISCGVCNGTGMTKKNDLCRLCKDGWLELGGAGMVHPNVLKAGNVDTNVYNGFAFGWGVERTYMMKAGTGLDDIRILYGNDIRFLEQF